MMSTHRYPRAAILPDYLRAGAGIAFTLVPFLLVPTGPAGGAVLVALAVLFGGFAVRTCARQRLVATCTSEGVFTAGLTAKKLSWSTLRNVELRYYTTRRDRSRGWIQLTLRGATTTLRFESTLDGFDHLVAKAVRAAAANGVVLSPATVQNLKSLGMGVPGRPGDGQIA